MTSHVPVDFSASWHNGSQRVRESNTQWFWFHHTFLAVRGPHCPRDADQSRGQGLVKVDIGFTKFANPPEAQALRGDDRGGRVEDRGVVRKKGDR